MIKTHTTFTYYITIVLHHQKRAGLMSSCVGRLTPKVSSTLKQAPRKQHQRISYIKYNKVSYTINNCVCSNKQFTCAVSTVRKHEQDKVILFTKKALSNNPLIKYGKKQFRHKEVHRNRCDQPGCTGKVCIELCGNPTDRKATGHITHGKAPTTEKDKITVNLMANKDFDRNKKDQNAILYQNSHVVNNTPQIQKATEEINSNTQIQQTILHFEDKK